MPGDQRHIPTCELGIWKPAHVGCPTCGPSGPCHDPNYEALIQETKRKDRFRRVLLARSLLVALLWLIIVLMGGSHAK